MCGVEFTAQRGPQQLNLDHSVPFSRGGDTTFENIQAFCRTCNLEKGPMTMDEYVDFIIHLVNLDLKL